MFMSDASNLPSGDVEADKMWKRIKASQIYGPIKEKVERSQNRGQFAQLAIEDKNSNFYHSAYERLAYLSDTYGPRMWGSEALEQVIHEVFTMAHK